MNIMYHNNAFTYDYDLKFSKNVRGTKASEKYYSIPPLRDGELHSSPSSFLKVITFLMVSRKTGGLHRFDVSPE